MAWSDILADPKFQAESAEKKQQVASDYFRDNIEADPEFQAEPIEKKTQVKQDFFSTIGAPVEPQPSTEKGLITGLAQEGLQNVSATAIGQPIQRTQRTFEESPQAPVFEGDLVPADITTGVGEDIVRGIKAAPGETLSYTGARAVTSTAGIDSPELIQRAGADYQPRTFAGKVAQGVTTMALDAPYYIGASLAAPFTGGASVAAIGPQLARLAPLFTPEFSRSYLSKIETGEVEKEGILASTFKSIKEAIPSTVAMGTAPGIGKVIGAPVTAKLGKAAGFAAEKTAEGAAFSSAHGIDPEGAAKSISEIMLMGVFNKFGSKVRLPEIRKSITSIEGRNRIAGITGLDIETVTKKIKTANGRQELIDIAEMRTADKVAESMKENLGVDLPDVNSKIKIGETEKAKLMLEKDLSKNLDETPLGLESDVIESRIMNKANSNKSAVYNPEATSLFQKFKNNAIYLTEHYTSGWGNHIANWTDNGREFNNYFNKYKLDNERAGGDAIRFGREVWDMSEVDKPQRKNVEEYMTDVLNKGKEWAAEESLRAGYKITPEQAAMVDRKVAAIRDFEQGQNGYLNRADKAGLKEINSDAKGWDVWGNPNGGFDVLNRKGFSEGHFETRTAAERFKKQNAEQKISVLDNYFARIIDKAAVDKDLASDKSEIYEYAIKNNLIPEGERIKFRTNRDAIAWLKQEINKDYEALTEAREGNLQYQRTWIELPKQFYARGEKAWIADAASKLRRVHRAETLGPRDERAYIYAEKVAEEASQKYDPDLARDMGLGVKQLLDIELGKAKRGISSNDKLTNLAMSAETISKMTTSQLGQLPQMLAPIITGGPKQYYQILKSLYGKDSKQWRRDIEQAGVVMDGLRKDVLDNMAGLSAERYLDFIKFTAGDRLARSLASAGGGVKADNIVKNLDNYYMVGDNIVKKGKVISSKSIGLVERDGAKRFRQEFYRDKNLRMLQRLNIDPREVIARGKKDGKYQLTQEERIKAMQANEIETNFRASAGDLVQFRSMGNVGKLMTQFKSFGFSQGRFIRDYVVSEARYGNLNPLIGLLLVGGFGGGVVKEIRNTLQGKDHLWEVIAEAEPEDKAKEIATGIFNYLATAGTFGLADMILQSTKYGDPQFGAVAGKFMKLMVASASAVAREKQKSRPFAQWAIGEMPLGSLVKPRVKEYWKEKDKEESESKLSPKQKYQKFKRELMSPKKKKEQEDIPFLEKYLL